MDRRKALKMFGTLFICLAGHPVISSANAIDDELSLFQLLNKPVDYHFSEEGMGNIIIECKDGTELIVPFSDIVEALKN